MSSSSSLHIGHTLQRSLSHKQRERPAGLSIPDEDKKSASDGEIRYERAGSLSDDNGATEQVISQSKLANTTLLIFSQYQHFDVNIHITEDPSTEPEQTFSRSASATSSLDPYYFGIQSESDEPIPPLPPAPLYLSTTPEHLPINEPVTPARNPAMIDRRGLVGVGELATPRWARPERTEQDVSTPDVEAEEYDLVVPEEVEDDQPDSPWTIEAVDGESSEKEEVRWVALFPSTSHIFSPLSKVPNMQPPPRPLRTRPSIADESGGEEILYPRNMKADQGHSSEDTPKVPRLPNRSPASDNQPMSPPSAFNPSTRKARKRTSDEFELDQTGSLVSKYSGSSSSGREKGKEDKLSTRKHRSLNVSSPPSRDVKGKDRRRESTGLTINSSVKSPTRTPDKHSRQISAGSTSSSAVDVPHSRRVHTTDFSHLPPSPSSSSIQQFLRNTATTTAPSQPSSLHRPSKDNLQMHSSPNVAHSLLRGTQEGWSALDDEATAEALRKLDGLSGKGARARASVGSLGRPSSSSRPGTPASKAGSQWEGLSGASDSGKSKRGSGNAKDSVSFKDKADTPRSIHPENTDAADNSAIATSSDDQNAQLPVVDKTPKKNAGARISFTPKRGSTSSTTYTSTPSSRDSASMSATTSVTSMSGTSGRHSSNKGRRNSAGSDISSVHSTDAALKDRVASIALNGDLADEGDVPPVPPLPKDLSTYRSPPATSTGLTFPPMQGDGKDLQSNNDGQVSRTISLDVPPYTSPVSSPPASSSNRRESQYYSSNSANESVPVVLKTPSKKWSFSSALNLKLSGSPSTSSQKSSSSFPLSPRSVTFGQQLRKSTSRDQHLSGSKSAPWSPDQPEAMTSAASLTSLSSVGSARVPAQPSKTPDRGPSSSRPGTGSSISTSHTTSGLAAPPPGPLSPSSSMRRTASKRLTPSSIPFFRRSSSQSMQLPPNGVLSSSPTSSFSGMLSAHPRPKQSTSPAQDYSSVSTSTPGTAHKKSSVLSLGLPSLLKSSSRRSLHSDAKESDKELQRAKAAARETEKERQKQEKQEKERQKKEDKDRSESRISVMMSRKRGKVGIFETISV